ncbi:xylulokinase [Sinanaerobacter chloroacetimidivorans]|uniref:xylulokinase n=1 Tax=Sinanaerobacter chloroacetimidivorans TaxID=2818044 RepID=UPI001D03BC49|nr:FGGY family carbohydrate kinase [Sinanaerobacter chloroacetimidivorans]
MKYIATFDIGTTAVKGVLMTASGKSVMEKSINLETILNGEYKEQRPEDWYAAFCEISGFFFREGLRPEDVSGIVMSGQMQDLIPVKADLEPACNAILYSDGRAGQQAREIADCIGTETIEKSTGNHFDGSIPFSKLLWLKQKKPAVYKSVEKILISSKDYVITRLTGAFITDVTSASTAGLMDIRQKCWNLQWMQRMDLDSEKLPDIRYAEEQVGTVTLKSSGECGYAAGTPVYAGTGDAGATTLASGISQDGEFNINLGTSGWIACVSHDILEKPGVFNLAAMPRNSYINVVPFLNAGNVHKWISGILAPEDRIKDSYEYVDRLLSQSHAGSHGVMFLPYLAGERFPVMDTVIKGSFVGIGFDTAKQDLARSALEGVAFSIRQGLESIERVPEKISLIGGGAQVKTWCQILTDVLGHEIIVYKGSEYLPAAAIAAAVLIDQGEIADYASFVNSLQNDNDSISYEPVPENTELYNKVYRHYLKMYPGIKSILS